MGYALSTRSSVIRLTLTGKPAGLARPDLVVTNESAHDAGVPVSGVYASTGAAYIRSICGRKAAAADDGGDSMTR